MFWFKVSGTQGPGDSLSLGVAVTRHVPFLRDLRRAGSLSNASGNERFAILRWTAPPVPQDDLFTAASQPRGVINLTECVSIKGAEEAISKPHSFEIATAHDLMYFIADDDKHKEDWINTVGKAIVRQSRALVSSFPAARPSPLAASPARSPRRLPAPHSLPPPPTPGPQMARDVQDYDTGNAAMSRSAHY